MNGDEVEAMMTKKKKKKNNIKNKYGKKRRGDENIKTRIDR